MNHKERVMNALRNYLESGNGFTFYGAIQDFATMKLYQTHITFADGETDKTIDDFALDVQIAVMNALRNNTIRGGIDSFYPWLHRVCTNKSRDYFKRLLEKKRSNVSLLSKDVEHGDVMDENPALFDTLYRDKGYDNYTLGSPIPPWIQGIDRDILLLILDGLNESQAAKELGLSEAAVWTRLSRLRSKVETGHYEEGHIKIVTSCISATRAFTATIVDVQNSRVHGTAMTIRYGRERDKATHAGNFNRARPNQSDFAVDVWNTARRHLTPGEFLYFRRTYFNFEEFLQMKNVTVPDRDARLDSAIREKLGTAFIQAGLYPRVHYMAFAELDMTKKLSPVSTLVMQPQTKATEHQRKAA